MRRFFECLSSIIVFDLDDEVLYSAQPQNVARFLIYHKTYLVDILRVRARWNSPSVPNNYFWTSLDAILSEWDAALLHLHPPTAQNTRFTYFSTPLTKCIYSPWEFLFFYVLSLHLRSPEIQFWWLHYQKDTGDMAINIYRVF